MKKSIRYIALLLSGIAFTCLAACSDDEGREPSPTVDPNCIGASFSGKNVGFKELEDTDPKEITLTITRDKTESAATVAIQTIANTENVFTIPQSVSFAAGATESKLIIGFENAGLKKEYSFEIALEASAVNPYKGKGHASFTIQRLRWVDIPGTFNYQDWVFGEYNNSPGYDVTVQQVEGENRFRIIDPFAKAAEDLKSDAAIEVEEPNEYLYFTINPQNKVFTFDSYSTGYIDENGSLIMGYSTLDFMGVDDVDSKYDPENHKAIFSAYYYGKGEDGGLIGQKESVLQFPADFELIEESEE